MKLDIVKRNTNGERPTDIARYLGLLPPTVQTILKNSNESRADGMACRSGNVAHDAGTAEVGVVTTGVLHEVPCGHHRVSLHGCQV